MCPRATCGSSQPGYRIPSRVWVRTVAGFCWYSTTETSTSSIRFLITDWLWHTPKEVLAKNFSVQPSVFDKVPKKELFIFQTGLPGDLKAEQAQAAAGTGSLDNRFDFKASTMQPTKVTPGGKVKIIDSKIFPVTPISAAIVTLKPGGLRELHWHPNAR